MWAMKAGLATLAAVAWLTSCDGGMLKRFMDGC
jgi:hypothetical protein